MPTRLWVVALAFLALTACTVEVKSHSWYPQSCCSNQDCAPVSPITHNPDGSMLMTTTYQNQTIQVLVPKGYPAQPSLDAEAHVCVRHKGWQVNGFYSTEFKPICLFLPGTS